MQEKPSCRQPSRYFIAASILRRQAGIATPLPSTGSLRDTRHNGIMAVRRGEAYYDDNGKLVYGQPPAKPEQDENGNYYVLGDDGYQGFQFQGHPYWESPY